MNGIMREARRAVALMGSAWMMGVGGVAAVAATAPRVAERAVSALCVNGRAFEEGPYREQIGELVGVALQNLPKEAHRVLKDAGLLGAKVNWATVSLGAVSPDDLRQKAMPPLAIAVSVDHDIARVAATVERGIREEMQGRASVVQTVIEDVPVWEIAQEGEAFVGIGAGKRPCFASLDGGRLLLAANQGTALAEQIRLFRSGEGRSRTGVRAVADMKKSCVARVASRALGPLVARFMPARTLSDLDRKMRVPNLADRLTNLRTGAGIMDLSPDGRELVLSLNVDAASAEDARTLRKLLTNIHQEARQHFNDANDEKASRRLVHAMLSRGVTIAGTGARIQVVARLPLANVAACQDERRAEEASLDASYRVQGEARKVFAALDEAGWPTATGGRIPESVRPLLKDWHVAVNVTDDVGDRVPVLVSSNLDPSQLLGAWDGQTDCNVPLSLRAGASSASGASWRDSWVVAVTKSGYPQVTKKKYLTYGVFYLRQAFACPENFAYATADGIVKPARKVAGRATTALTKAPTTAPTTQPTTTAVDSLLRIVPVKPTAVIQNIGDTATRGLRNLFSR